MLFYEINTKQFFLVFSHNSVFISLYLNPPTLNFKLFSFSTRNAIFYWNCVKDLLPKKKKIINILDFVV